MVKSPLSCVRVSKIVMSREKEEEEKGERGKRGFACYFGGKQWRSLKLEKLAKRKTAILPRMFSHLLKTLRGTFRSGAAAQTRDPTILKRLGIMYGPSTLRSSSDQTLHFYLNRIESFISIVKR